MNLFFPPGYLFYYKYLYHLYHCIISLLCNFIIFNHSRLIRKFIYIIVSISDWIINKIVLTIIYLFIHIISNKTDVISNCNITHTIILHVISIIMYIINVIARFCSIIQPIFIYINSNIQPTQPIQPIQPTQPIQPIQPIQPFQSIHPITTM